MQRDFIFTFVYQNKKDMIHYLFIKKEGGVSFFLSLSFTYFTMIHKKRVCLLSAKIGTDSSNYGKMGTF
jgi:hypothetical protein